MSRWIISGDPHVVARNWGKVNRSTRQRRYLSARKIFVIGLVCFGTWLFFDARQLYQSANASPIGVRRSVAMAILSPIARVEETVGFDRVVNGANRIVGKSGTPGGSVVALPVTPKGGVSSKKTGDKPPGRITSGTQVVVKPKLPAPLAQPSLKQPLTILDVGDSIGEDLGLGLTDAFAHAKKVRFLAKSVGNTGLANLAYYNWIAQLPAEIAAYHPKVVIVMLGGNDGQSFQQGNTVAELGTATWERGYGQRVGQMMTEATSAGAHVIWVGLPIMGPSSGLSNTNVLNQNAIYQAQAKLHPGVTYVSTWKLFENEAGQYSTYLHGPGGGLVQVRGRDETHIAPPGGTDILGAFVVKAIESAWHVKL